MPSMPTPGEKEKATPFDTFGGDVVSHLNSIRSITNRIEGLSILPYLASTAQLSVHLRVIETEGALCAFDNLRTTRMDRPGIDISFAESVTG